MSNAPVTESATRFAVEMLLSNGKIVTEKVFAETSRIALRSAVAEMNARKGRVTVKIASVNSCK